MKKLIGYFLQGLLYTVPLAVTVFILVKTFQFVDGLLKPQIEQIIPFKIPGLGILIILIFVTLVGIVGRIIITNPVKSFFNKLIEKAPLIKVIYSSVNELLSAFVGKEKKFNKPVLVKINKIYDLEKIGFMTQSDLSHLGIEGEKVVVYFPHSYAWSGEHFIVPIENITPIDAHPADVMKFIVSGGVTRI